MAFVVTDLDTPDNGSPFTFDIVAGNNEGEFHVSSSGVLSTAGKLSKQVNLLTWSYDSLNQIPHSDLHILSVPVRKGALLLDRIIVIICQFQ